MAKIIPFRAVRPAEEKVALVTTRAYDEYSATELASWLDFNPYSFLHIINPAFINQQKIDSISRYRMVGTKYRDFKNNNTFVKEDKDCMFLYEIVSPYSQHIGIIAGTSIEEYKSGAIKKHENTLEYRVENMKKYFKESRFNTEPVLMMHPQSSEMENWIELKKIETPLYRFATTNKETHTLWRVNSERELDFLTQLFSSFEQLYIADGHHRTESIRQLSDEYGCSSPDLNYILSYIVCETKIKINPFHRMVHDLNGLGSEHFIELISEHYEVKKVHEFWKPKEKHQVGMYLNEQFYQLKLKHLPDENLPTLDKLDAEILYQTILHPILGIKDLRTDSRISYIPGNKNLVELTQKVDSGENQVGFILFPQTIEDIKNLAHEEQTMPPKSTYIEPKIRNGLIVYEY